MKSSPSTKGMKAGEIPAVDIPTSTIQYNGILGSGVSLQYEVDTSSVKENIIISEPQSAYNFIFEIEKSDGLTLTADAEGQIVASKSNGDTVFFIPAPFMYDNNGMCSDNVQYTLMDIGEKVILHINASASWINASSRSFPVVIDPIVDVVRQNNIDNVQVYENNYNSAKYNQSRICVGKQNNRKWQGYYKFDLSVSHDMRYAVLGATLNYRKIMGWFTGGDTVNFDVYVTESFSNSNTVNWNNKPNTIAKVASDSQAGGFFGAGSNSYIPFDPSYIVDNSITFGFIPTSSINEYLTIREDKKLYLTLTYKQTMGIENDYTMETFEGNGFTNYVNVLGKQLTTVVDYTEVNNGVLPINISGIYNAGFDDVKYEVLKSHYNLSNINTHLRYYGNNFKLNLEQYCVPYKVQGGNHYAYIDADGTPHTLWSQGDNKYAGDGYEFRKGSSSGTGSIYKNNIECLRFENGYLKRILDPSGYYLLIEHGTTNAVKCISSVKYCNSSNTLLQTVSLTYSNNNLSAIQSNYGGENNVYIYE